MANWSGEGWEWGNETFIGAGCEKQQNTWCQGLCPSPSPKSDALAMPMPLPVHPHPHPHPPAALGPQSEN